MEWWSDDGLEWLSDVRGWMLSGVPAIYGEIQLLLVRFLILDLFFLLAI